MSQDSELKRYVIKRSDLPKDYPTHRHAAEFWEALGRTVATFGFLEEVLGKAIFVFTGTRRYRPEEIDAAYRDWLPQLERALSDQLWKLAVSYEKAVLNNPDATITYVTELVGDIKKASVIRNVLCHGSWGSPNATGASLPFFFNSRQEIVDTSMDVAYLRQVQTHVADLACSVIESVTHMGWQFPGSRGPGRALWP